MRLSWIKWASVTGLLIAVSCRSLDVFDVHESSAAVVPGGSALELLAGDAGFGSLVGFDISQNETIKNKGVDRHEIDSVRLETLRLTVTDPPSGQDLSFLDQVQFYVSAEGLERKLIADGGPFPDGATTVLLNIKAVELAPYVAAPQMDITADVNGHRPPQDTTVQADVGMMVNVNLDGALCN
jgi:hypothetical protein